jgi:dTDP-4-dehydrorhamnose reductase
MRIVIIGTGGRVGGALARHFRLAGHAVIGFDRTALDLTRPDIIRDRLEPLAFDTVLLPGALTNLERAEAHPDEARAANVEGPALVAALCAARGARLIHFSTDYTYDGTRPGLRVETEVPGPISTYARTKAEGDRRVLEATEGAALIARVSWIFGPDRPAFPDQLLERARTGAALEAIADKFSMPTSALDLCTWLEPFVDGPHRALGGIVNFCNSGELASWHSYGQTALDLAATLGVPIRSTVIEPRKLEEVTAFKARRPVHTAMSNQKLASLLKTPPRPWPSALRDYLRTYHAPA